MLLSRIESSIFILHLESSRCLFKPSKTVCCHVSDIFANNTKMQVVIPSSRTVEREFDRVIGDRVELDNKYKLAEASEFFEAEGK